MLNITSFIRITKTGFSNFTRNWLLSAAASLVMTITLVIFAILALLFSVTNYSVNAIQQRVDISIYMKRGLGEERILDIKQALEQDPLIKEVAYVSAAQALEEFKERNKDKAKVLSALNVVGENPLLATLRVKAKNLEDYPQISESISGGQFAGFIDTINYNDNRVIIDQLAQILKIVASVGFGLVAVFSSIAILVMFNTLRLTIYNRREEVEIMRLVGATNWYIRGPFLAEAIMYSLTAAIITSLLLIPVYGRVLPRIWQYIAPGQAIEQTTTYVGLVVVLLASALVLSVISTLLAIRRYLKI